MNSDSEGYVECPPKCNTVGGEGGSQFPRRAKKLGSWIPRKLSQNYKKNAPKSSKYAYFNLFPSCVSVNDDHYLTKC